MYACVRARAYSCMYYIILLLADAHMYAYAMRAHASVHKRLTQIDAWHARV